MPQANPRRRPFTSPTFAPPVYAAAGGGGGGAFGGGPDPYAGGAGGPGGGAPPSFQWGGPSAAPPAPSRQGINLGRATDAVGAATFAAGAPLPMSLPINAAVTRGGREADPAGMPLGGPMDVKEYNGAFGRGPEAQHAAQAARAAYIERHMAIANAQDFGNGVNYFQNQGLQNDWNERQQAQSEAAVGVAGAQAAEHGAKAAAAAEWSRTIAPATAAEMAARAAEGQARARDTAAKGQLYPAQAEKTRSEAGLNDARGAATAQWAESGAAGAQQSQKELAALRAQMKTLQERHDRLVAQTNRAASGIDGEEYKAKLNGAAAPNAAGGGPPAVMGQPSATPPGAAPPPVPPASASPRAPSMFGGAASGSFTAPASAAPAAPPGAPAVGQTITNPNTGEKRAWNGSAWVPA